MTQQNHNENGNAQQNAAPQENEVRYPLMESAADSLTTASGRKLNTISLEAVAAGEVHADDLQVSASTLRAQATLA